MGPYRSSSSSPFSSSAAASASAPPGGNGQPASRSEQYAATAAKAAASLAKGPEVRLTVNGRAVTVAAGATLLEAAEAAGVHVPT